MPEETRYITDQQFAQALTAIINLMLTIGKASDCDLTSLADQIQAELTVLQPPYAGGVYEVVLRKFLERIWQPPTPSEH